MSALKKLASLSFGTKLAIWDSQIYLLLALNWSMAPWLISKRTGHILFAINYGSGQVGDKNMHLKAFTGGAIDCQR